MTSGSVIRPVIRRCSRNWGNGCGTTTSISGSWCATSAIRRPINGVRNATQSNVTDERNFAHAGARRIRAEMLLDCICQVTETKEKFRGLPLGARAVQIADGQTSTYFLTTFGRARRDTVCAAEVSTDPSLSQALHMLNGSTVTGKIAGRWRDQPDAGVRADSGTSHSNRSTCGRLTRKPTPDETQRLMDVVKQAENPELGLQDVFWAVLNAREFVFNH